jgi:sucrose-6-phosphate hydrolase SacC (GH32 family)
MNRRQFAQLAAGAAAPLLAQTQTQTQEPLYREKYRPQFHFSPRKGWTNDPNGLVFYKGEYHLFFQHNPFDVKWGNMTWGHALSTDMVHWTQVENALEPDKLGTMYSGSAVVDWQNTAGFQKGEEKTIVLIYTAAGGTSPESQGQPHTQCIAYSTDRGRTFTKYAGNPVVPHIVGGNRDPKVVWHEPTSQWIMALFLEGNTFGFLASRDLKKWTMLHHITVPKVAECPDFFEMPVENEPGVSKWIWTGANGNYLIGSFDGRRFVPEVMTTALSSGQNYYAAQTFSDLPGNRRVQMAWMNGGQYPGMPFNQQMSCPYEFKLRKQGYGSYRIHALPIQEIEALRGTLRSWKDLELKAGENPLAGVSGELWDIAAEIEIGAAKEVGFRVRGRAVSYQVKPNAGGNSLSSADLTAQMGLRSGRIKLRVLVDRTTVEVFGNDGEVVIPTCFLPPDGNSALELFATGGVARVISLDLYPMQPAWRMA